MIHLLKKLTPTTKYFCLFAFFNILIINIALKVIPGTNFDGTVLRDLSKAFIKRDLGIDSWWAMTKAFEHIQLGKETPLYAQVFFEDKVKFQYPPTSLIPFSLLKQFSNNGTVPYELLNVISLLFFLAMIFFTLKIFKYCLDKFIYRNNYFDKYNTPVLLGLALLLSLTFYPGIKAYSIGQIQTWLNSLFAITFWCWLSGRKSISGVLVGIMCFFKPQYAVILVWSILRKQWTFTFASFSTVFLGLLTSILLYGFANHIDYLSVLSFISKHGEVYFPNNSINGLLNRLLLNGDSLKWENHAFASYNPWIYAATTISSIAFIAAALFPPRVNQRGSIIDFAIVGLTCTIASPVAWEHHYGILLAIYAFLFPYLLGQQGIGKTPFFYLGASYILSSSFFEITNAFAHVPLLNILQSYLFFGALMILLHLHFLGRMTPYQGINSDSELKQL